MHRGLQVVPIFTVCVSVDKNVVVKWCWLNNIVQFTYQILIFTVK